MCGIVGTIAAYGNGFTMDEARAFRDMVVVDSLRGFDSTGVFTVAHNGNMEMLKEASTGATFVTRKEYAEFNTEVVMRGMFAVGHNRAATRGTVNDVNAHPFCVNDNIILVQNGTYNGSHRHHKDTDVDTEAIAWVLDAHPTDIQQALQKIDAAYCLVWYNMKDQALYIIRNAQRPLHIAYTEAGGVMYASEPETIMLAASRNNIKLKQAPYLVDADTLFKWQLDTKAKTHTFSQIKLDNTFRQTHAPHRYGGHVWGNHHDYSLYADIEEKVVTSYPVHNVRQIASNIKNDITIHTHVYDGKFDNYIISDSQARELRDDLLLRSRESRLTVEFAEYFPASSSQQAGQKGSWYVCGSPVQVGDYPMPVTYTLLFDKTELEIYEMIDKNVLYSVIVPGTPIEHMVKDERGVAGRIVTLFCSNLQEIEHEKAIH